MMAERRISRESGGHGPLVRFSPTNHTARSSATTANTEPPAASTEAIRDRRAATHTFAPTIHPSTSPIAANARNPTSATTAWVVGSVNSVASCGATMAPTKSPSSIPPKVSTWSTAPRR